MLRLVSDIPSLHTCRGWYYVLPLALVLLLSNTSRSGAQSISGDISIEEGGQLWIEGSAGIVDYRCTAQALSGAGVIENRDNPRASVASHGQVRIAVTLPVQSLDCGKRAMNKDMYEALKADEHQYIQYTLLDAVTAEESMGTPPDSSGAWMNIRTLGLMEIAGVRDSTTIYVKGRMLSPRRFRVRGSKQIHMDTFRIKPPTAMFGLIRADKELTVHFDVTVQLDSARVPTADQSEMPSRSILR